MGNQSSFMNKTLQNAFISRSKQRNLFLKNKTKEYGNTYVKQRKLYVTLLQKSKREFLGSLKETDLSDNKKFWDVIKLLLSNKVVSNENVTLLEVGNIVENDENTASVLNNIITTQGIPQYSETEPMSHKIGDLLMKEIV